MDKENGSLTVNGIEYVRADVTPSTPGTRAVVVVDRGWIWAGDCEVVGDDLVMTDVVHVYRWESIGFAAVCDDPTQAGVDLRAMGRRVEVPLGSVIFRVPVPDGWGR